MKNQNNPSVDNSTPPSDTIASQVAIKQALQQFGSEQKTVQVKTNRLRRSLLWIYLIIAAVSGISILALQQGLFNLAAPYIPLLQQFSLAVFLSAAILVFKEFLMIIWIRRITDTPSRFNLNRLVGLLSGLAIVIAVASAMFANWTTGLISLGVLSIILGLALQAPLGNLFAWFFILTRQPYRVGDRIRINDATGDVIDVGYFDTTLWEFGGQYLSTDHPSGRIIKFPNSLVLNYAVYNYSWALFPYIWNEVRVFVAYGADMDFVAETMQQAAMEEIGTEMAQRVDMYRKLLAKTPVDEIDVNEKPVVLFRAHDNTWIEAVVRFLVDPKHAGPIKTRIFKQCVTRLKVEPERVMFPQGDAR